MGNCNFAREPSVTDAMNKSSGPQDDGSLNFKYYPFISDIGLTDTLR